MNIGRRCWAVPEGYLPEAGPHPRDPRLRSHETICVLNAGAASAQLSITIYFADREPIGPFRARIAPRRTLHLRFDDLRDPEPIPRCTDFASVIESDVPVVVQHTRLDARDANLALLTTLAFGADT